jgi:hypothetical protein
MASKKKAAPAEKTCAVCDYELDDSAIKVRFGRHVVEVCCEECAQKLREARAATAGAGS